MVCDMEHDPDAIHRLTAAVRVKQSCHVAILVRQTEFPGIELVVELTVFLLPLLNVRQRTNIDRSLEEAVSLGEDADNLDVVAKGAKILRLVHRVVGPLGSLEPACIDRLIPREEIVSTGLEYCQSGRSKAAKLSAG